MVRFGAWIFSGSLHLTRKVIKVEEVGMLRGSNNRLYGCTQQALKECAPLPALPKSASLSLPSDLKSTLHLPVCAQPHSTQDPLSQAMPCQRTCPHCSSLATFSWVLVWGTGFLHLQASSSMTSTSLPSPRLNPGQWLGRTS